MSSIGSSHRGENKDIGMVPREPLGRRARKIFVEFNLFTSAKYPPIPIAHHPLVKPIALFLAIIWFAIRVGPRVWAATGVLVSRQVADLWYLGFGEGIDPLTYYLQELYLPGGRIAASLYLTRYETKNGLIKALNTLVPSPYPVSEMTDKLLFAECCARFDLPTPPILLAIDQGVVDWRGNDSTDLDQDLFAKPRRGKGARGTTMYRRVAAERYQTPAGEAMRLEEVIRQLQSQSLSTSMLLQPRLRNHRMLADLSCDSLVVVRVITCLNEKGVPEVTHGILRILSKLESSWRTNDEFGAPIDLETGELGPLASDRAESCCERFDVHPITGSMIFGRRLAAWGELSALAVAAHRRFPHRVLIGWDLALTDRGPMVLEGNNVLDVAFPQRTYSCPIGQSRLGTLLHFHLDRLCAAAEANLSWSRTTSGGPLLARADNVPLHISDPK